MFVKINKIPKARCRDQPDRAALSIVIPRPTLFYEHWLAVFLILIFLPAFLHAQTVLTVKEAEFRSRWAGKQEDRTVTPQYYAPGGGLDEETKAQIAAESPSSLKASPARASGVASPWMNSRTTCGAAAAGRRGSGGGFTR